MSFFENIINLNIPIKKFQKKINNSNCTSAFSDKSIYDFNVNNKTTKCYSEISGNNTLDESINMLEKLEAIFGTKCI